MTMSRGSSAEECRVHTPEVGCSTHPPATTIEFFVPHVPVAQGRHRTATRDRRGNVLARPHQYTDPKTSNIREVLAWYATQHRPPKLIEGPVRFAMAVYRLRPKSWKKGQWAWTGKPDCDNFSKLKDAFNGLIWVDDSQVIEEIICKRVCEDRQGYLIRIQEIQEEDA